MEEFTKPVKRSTPAGFTLVEVVIAIGILGASVLAIIAFLGSIGKATSDVMDSAVAATIAANVRAELDKEDVDDLYLWSDPNDPIKLLATSDGERVRMLAPNDVVSNHPVTGTPTGIAQHDQYFQIIIRRLERTMPLPATFSDSAMLPLSVEVVWPYRVKTGPASSEPGQPGQQSRYVFNTVILRKQ